MGSAAITWERRENRLWQRAALLVRPLQFAVANPSLLYVAAMTVFLFRPPDIFSYSADRLAFGALVFFVALRTMILREKIPFFAGLSLPMIGLVILATLRALREPFDPQVWSIIASKFIVPFCLFHIAVLVFREQKQRRHFEIFILFALAYLIFTAIAFLTGIHCLIFPRFILDESLGFHADRARGPFLQAVANGVSLNLLAILASVLPEKRTRLVSLLWFLMPLAVLATMTRAVWISFALSVVALGFRSKQHRIRTACVVLIVGGLLGGLIAGLNDHSLKRALWDRTEERGPVDARMAVYNAGWAMFQERPLAGWSAGSMYAELARRMEGYHLRTFYVHNTYLALLVEFGLPGFLLYVVLFINLFRLARRRLPQESRTVAALRKAWPVMLCVYLFNAFFVDMAYQFVIGLLFTSAGMLCASQECNE
jgi:putative inorganic carbon (HCO3(-)) transporter